jgi:hypothetical protein
MSAAIEAACGVAADVPKKFGKLASFAHPATDEGSVMGGLAEASVNPRKVLLTPSGPTKFGFWRTTGVASRVPVESNRIGPPPSEEKDSRAAGVVPQRGVSAKKAAPTAAAPAALG